MADCKLANGQTLSAEDIERECAEYESGTWDGQLDCIPVGPAAIADEPLVTVTVKFPASMIAAVDERSSDRFDYIRRAVAAAIFADACEMAAEWLQGECEYQAIHDEPFPKQTFGNQPKNGVRLLLSRSMPTKALFAKLTHRVRLKRSALPRVVFRRWSRRISWKLLGMGALFG